MMSQVRKVLLARIRIPWRLLFQGRYLMVTNTVGGGGLMALGDCMQQSWEIYMEAGRVRDWKRTGRELAIAMWK